MHFDAEIPTKVVLDGKYKIDGKVLVLPINGEGHCRIEFSKLISISIYLYFVDIRVYYKYIFYFKYNKHNEISRTKSSAKLDSLVHNFSLHLFYAKQPMDSTSNIVNKCG